MMGSLLFKGAGVAMFLTGRKQRACLTLTMVVIDGEGMRWGKEECI